MDEKHRLLRRHWGYESFRPMQEEIIDSVLQGSDTLALLPTGGGKSLCYQLPALMLEGMCLVVSPLIALMKDQVQQLNARHIKAACLVAGMRSDETSDVLANAVGGGLKLLYVSPERLKQRMFIEHFRRMRVSMIAVDEAHCVSQWGYDFRPPYLQIALVRVYHPSAPLIALTATATPAVANDICALLQMRSCRRFSASFVRPNLTYSVSRDGDKTRRLLQLVGSIGGQGIVYTRSRRGTQAVAQTLQAAGVSATFYHAGLSARERDSRQAAWMRGESSVMVATNAFGMGIDKPDVRFVIHIDMPDSLEAYFQEAGRAGRDGKEAMAIMICDEADAQRRHRDLQTDFPSLRYIRNVYRALCNLYRIPMGSGADLRFDFDLVRVCDAYNFAPREFYSACRFLEREGLIAIPDRENLASTLHVPVSRDQLYRFQVDHQRLGDLLQLLMRMYPGLLAKAVPIDERKVAARCYSDAADVVAQLTSLHEMHIVDYRPHTDKPQIFFLAPRIDEASIFARQHDYDRLRQGAEQRVEAVCRYAAQDERCRGRFLVEYFGERCDADCGRCDVCLRGAHRPPQVEDAILAHLRRGPLTLAGLNALLAADGIANATDALRQLVDRGEVLLDTDMLLRLP